MLQIIIFGCLCDTVTISALCDLKEENEVIDGGQH